MVLLGMVATNNDIADAKADCKVCPSGRYQNEAGTTECKNCPAGTMRAADSANDNKFWDGQTSSSNMQWLQMQKQL